MVCEPSDNESSGLVAIDAQACGTPVVAAAVAGLATAVRHGETGLLVDGHDPADYAAAIGRLLADREALAAMGRAAVRNAARFSWVETAGRTRDAGQAAIAAAQAPQAAVG